MTDWQERITRESAPAIRAEHELRYRILARLLRDSDAWADLGCGNGLAAERALGSSRPARTLLVDFEPAALARAAEVLAVEATDALVADLSDAADLDRIGRQLAGVTGHLLVSMFEVVEHLPSFVPLLDWCTRIAGERAATFVLSVPNDAFWSIQNPHHETTWSEGAFEELRQLLPSEHTLLRQVALSGSAMVAWEGSPARRELDVAVGGEGVVATHFIAAFGSRHCELETGALAVQTDLSEQRRWERQRESDAAVAQAVADAQRAAVAAQDATIAKQREELHAQTQRFDEWRSYIHELERELGRPLSGSAESAAERQEPR
jgi:SAM-dependent methyltransferase